jgi:hypothetical protein
MQLFVGFMLQAHIERLQMENFALTQQVAQEEEVVSATKREAARLMADLEFGAERCVACVCSGCFGRFIGIRCIHTVPRMCTVSKFQSLFVNVTWAGIGSRAPRWCCIALKMHARALFSAFSSLAVSDIVTRVVSQGVQRSQPVRVHRRSATITTLACILLQRS